MLIPLKAGAGLGAGLDACEPPPPHPVAARRTVTTKTGNSSTSCKPAGRGLLFWARIDGCLHREGSFVNNASVPGRSTRLHQFSHFATSRSQRVGVCVHWSHETMPFADLQSHLAVARPSAQGQLTA